MVAQGLLKDYGRISKKKRESVFLKVNSLFLTLSQSSQCLLQ